MKKYIFIILLAGFWGCGNRIESADIIIIIPSYTMNSDQPWVEAIAIKNNKIIFVGNKKEALLYKNNSTHLIEDPNGMVLPGFIDSHVHLIWGGIEMSECHLHNLQTEEQIYIPVCEPLAAILKTVPWPINQEAKIFPGLNCVL